MKEFRNDHEMFALRHWEKMLLHEKRPKSGRFIAVRLQTAPTIPGEWQTTDDGRPAELLAVLAAELQNGNWLWAHLTPFSKEIIGTYMLDDCKAEVDVWYYLSLEDMP